MFQDILIKVAEGLVLAIIGYLVHLVGRLNALEADARLAKELAEKLGMAHEKVEDDKAARLAEALKAMTDFGRLMAKVEAILESTDRRLHLLERHVFSMPENT